MPSTPTSHPSSQPTSHPSSQPTSHQSSQHTSHPSSQPTSHPNSYPSAMPSTDPSSQPMSHPSSKPTALPTSEPTSEPTSQPSFSLATLWRTVEYPNLLSSITDGVTIDNYIIAPQYAIGLVDGDDIFQNLGGICSGWERYLYSTLLRSSDSNIGVGLSFGI